MQIIKIFRETQLFKKHRDIIRQNSRSNASLMPPSPVTGSVPSCCQYLSTILNATKANLFPALTIFCIQGLYQKIKLLYYVRKTPFKKQLFFISKIFEVLCSSFIRSRYAPSFCSVGQRYSFSKKFF